MKTYDPNLEARTCKEPESAKTEIALAHEAEELKASSRTNSRVGEKEPLLAPVSVIYLERLELVNMEYIYSQSWRMATWV
jgi:hypothetical protein